jgi:hypothetical protein
MRSLLASLFVAGSLVGCMLSLDESPRRGGEEGCYVGGCSSQLCSDRTDIASTCEWRDDYACYRTASCERQATGECGWTETAELTACLDTH